MRKFVLIASLGTAAAGGACTDATDGTCSSQGSSLLQKRSSLGRATTLEEGKEQMVAAMNKRIVETSLSAARMAWESESAARPFFNQLAASMAKGGDKVTPCASTADFKSTAVAHESCKFETITPDAQTCQDAGCFHIEGDDSECVCTSESSCKQLGGTYSSATCGELLSKCGPECEAFKEAQDKGTCDGLKWKDGPLNKIVAKVASICCNNFPKTVCDTQGKVTTPCVKDEDFLSDTIYAGKCRFNGKGPSGAECESNGCHSSPDGACYCIDEEPCKKSGGTFKGFTCQQMGAMGDLVEPIKDAKKSGICPKNDSFPIKFFAERCCKSFPAHTCNPSGEILTMCKNDDFTPTSIFTAYCTGTETATEDECKAAGCEHHGQCFCQKKDECNKIKGFWREFSCKQYLDFMDTFTLSKAKKSGKCDDDHKMEFHYAAGVCCTSKKSVCGE